VRFPGGPGNTPKTKPSGTLSPYALLAALFFACKVYGQTPVISTFSPNTGAVGSTLSITGSNFSATPANNIVYFGGVIEPNGKVYGTVSIVKL
jgi:hypothetical protein